MGLLSARAMMPSPSRAALCALLLSLGSLSAQEADLTEKLYRSGERAYATKAYAEAMDSWNQVVTGAPKSPQAPLALVRMARHKLEVDRNPEAALPLLDKVRTEHLQSPAAREAILLRGIILARKAHRPQELREAVAEFNRLVDLFPDSAEAAEAQAQIGQAFLDQGQPLKAFAAFSNAAQRDPAAPVTPRALLAMAEIEDQAGNLEGCLTLLQRILDRHPASPEAVEARWRVAVRVRHRLQKLPLKALGSWPAGRVKWLKTPTLMSQNASGDLFIFQDDLDQAFRLTPSGLEPAGAKGKNAKALAMGPDGLPWPVIGKQGAVRPDGSQVPLASLANPSGAFLDRWGHLWVGDAKAASLTVVAPDGSPRNVASPVASALAPMPDGGVVVASDANRSLIFLTQAGQIRTQVAYEKGLPGGFKNVMALATDPLGHVAALVEGGDFEGLVLWGPDGAVLRHATYKALGIAGRFRAVVLDRQGGLILADRTNDLLLRVE
jgi:TolA-binding protein